MMATALAGVSKAISGTTVEWRCEPQTDRPRIYFANHSSHLDFIVIWAALPASLRCRTRPVAGRDYWAQGVVRRYLASHVFDAVLIERRHAGSAQGLAGGRASMHCMAEAMGETGSLIVFPEGTRSLDGRVANFKAGLYHLSRLRPEAELIPVYLDNLNRILPKGEAVPVPMLSRVVFGQPVPSAGDDKDAFLAETRAALIQLIQRS
jgi:1-acyl-sn-glycerol-3-phosphate acyltransferase